MKSETATVTLTHTERRRRSAAWKATLILIPIVTAGLLFWLRQAQVQQLTNRTISSYGTRPVFRTG